MAGSGGSGGTVSLQDLELDVPTFDAWVQQKQAENPDAFGGVPASQLQDNALARSMYQNQVLKPATSAALEQRGLSGLNLDTAVDELTSKGQTSLLSAMMSTVSTDTSQPFVPSADFGSLNRDFAYKDFNYQADPGYDFRLAEGQKALERSAASKAGILSGAAAKDAIRYGQKMGSEEFANSYNRYAADYERAFNTFQTNRANKMNPLLSLAGLGQTSVAQLNSQGANAAAQQGQNLMAGTAGAANSLTDAANARASGYVGGANAWSNALTGIGNTAQNMYLYNLLNR
jgi:hypothetical protein